MPEVLFYHLTGSALEASLPEMLERSLARGWRVLLRCGSAAGMGAIDEMLWTWRDDSFLPHGAAKAAHPARQPILLTTGLENPNRANVLMLVDGARAEPREVPQYERVCVIFDGHDPAAIAAAREDWKAVRSGGWPARYWAQEGGRWVEKGGG